MMSVTAVAHAHGSGDAMKSSMKLWGRINASTDLPLKHTRNKLYKELVLQHLVLQLFDDSRKGSTRFVSTGIRSTKI